MAFRTKKPNLKHGIALLENGVSLKVNQKSGFVSLPMPGLEKWSFYVLFDGEDDGSFANEILSKELIESILNEDKKLFDSLATNASTLNQQAVDKQIKLAIQNAFKKMNKQKTNPDVINELNGPPRQGFSTIVACLISPTHIYLVDCDDSMCMLTSNKKIVEKSKETEHEEAGEEEATTSTQASMATNQLFRNVRLDQLDIHVHERTVHDEYIVLATEGVWSVSNVHEEFRQFIDFRLKLHDLPQICKDILEVCYSERVGDNLNKNNLNIFCLNILFLKKKIQKSAILRMGIILVALPGVQKIDKTEINLESQTNKLIKELTKGIN